MRWEVRAWPCCANAGVCWRVSATVRWEGGRRLCGHRLEVEIGGVMFDSWQAFFAMGGHGLYVWMAYLSALGLVAANLVQCKVERRRTWRLLRAAMEASDHASPAP